MADYHQLSITEISRSVSADKLDEMQHQTDAWHGLAYLLDSQLSRLATVTRDLGAAWSGPAGQAFVAEVAKAQQALTQARDVAKGNAVAWGQVINEATSTRENIFRLEGKYRTELIGAQDKFTADQHDWRNNPIFNALGITGPPTPPNEAAIRAKYDKQARDLLDHASSVYADQFHALQDVPIYSGPVDNSKTLWGTGDGSDSSTGDRGTAHLVGGAALTAAAGVGAGWTGVGPDLAGTTARPPAPPTYLPPTTPPPGSPPGIGGPLGGPFPPIRPVGPGRGPQIPTGRTPLLPEPVAVEQPTIGSRPPLTPSRGRTPAMDESVIGSRRSATAGGPERPVVRPSDGRAVIGRETPAAGRSGLRARTGGLGEDGVVRSGRAAATSGGQGDRRDRRHDEDSPTMDAEEGTELWEVTEGVDPVVEPAETYDPRRDRPGPTVGRGDGRLR